MAIKVVSLISMTLQMAVLLKISILRNISFSQTHFGFEVIFKFLMEHPVVHRGNTIPYKSSHANENPHFKRGFDFIKCRIKNRCHTSN